MVDRYTPKLDEFVLTAEEEAAIAAALATDKPWSWKPGGASQIAIASVKAKIREHHLHRHGHLCCYCRLNLYGTGYFMSDREHVLPKSVEAYRKLAYAIWNLGIACKRCNMEYKKDRVDFVVSPEDEAKLSESEGYRFIHPNFDLYDEHLARYSIEEPGMIIVKYRVKKESLKGAYTYHYFNLRGLEVESFDQAQGLTIAETSGGAAAVARALAKDFGQ